MIPPGLPIVWSAPLVVARLVQAEVQALRRHGRWQHSASLKHSPRVVGWAEEVGIQFVASKCAAFARGRRQALIACEACERPYPRLYLASDAWLCPQCAGGAAPRAKQKLLRYLADYAFARAIDCRGRDIRRRWRDTSATVAAFASQARTVEDLALLALAGVVLGLGRSPAKYARVPAGLTRAYVPVLIDSLLHPAAYKARVLRQGVAA